MLPLLAVLLADRGQCTAPCTCQADAVSATLMGSHRLLRKTAASFDIGQLDTAIIDEAQTSLSASVDAVRELRSTCGSPPASCGNSSGLLPRRSCRCRLARLLNITTAVQRRLDDAAANVLFGDSEQNVEAIAAAVPAMAHGTNRVAIELAKYGRRCDTRAPRKAKLPARGKGLLRSIAHTGRPHPDEDTPQQEGSSQS
jgi:hypothetical protein